MVDFSVGRVAAAYASQGVPSLDRPDPMDAVLRGSPGLAAPGAGAAQAPNAAMPVAPSGDSFGAFIDRAVTQAVNTVSAGEQASLEALSGQVSTQEVVQKVIAAEMTVQSVIAIRDKMVQAYQEIMRMPI